LGTRNHERYSNVTMPISLSSSWLHRKKNRDGILGDEDGNRMRKISSHSSKPSHLLIKNITYGYTPHKPIIVNINLLIPKGRFVGLVGPSGSGKSTLVKIIAGLFKPWSGSIDYFYASSNNIDKLGNSNGLSYSNPKNGINSVIIGYVPQIEAVDWNFPVTVKEVVGMGAWDKSGVTPFLSKNIASEINHALDSLGIHSQEFGKRQIRELSGGEQQRVFLARALIRKPNILLLDEPTSGVDHKTQEKILSILMSLSLAGITIIMTTHDLSGIARRLQWVVCMNKRVIAEGYPREVLTERNLLKTYGLVGSGDDDGVSNIDR
jgi:ABC-type Mn2+/Zn2+ transport system ATPase subunit